MFARLLPTRMKAAAALLACAVVCHGLPSNEIVVGQLRVQALSPTLIRVEPRGPRGFEDAHTFMVTNRSFPGLPIRKVREGPDGAVLQTAAYTVLLRLGSSASPSCGAVTSAADVSGPVYTTMHPNGTNAASRQQCCGVCDADSDCVGWLYDTDTGAANRTNCRLLSRFDKRLSENDCADDKATLEFGCSKRSSCGSLPSFKVTGLDGKLLYDTELDMNPTKERLHWPAPLSSSSYALVDYPRFNVPEWGAVPIPTGASVEPELQNTNGYDFRNSVHGDVYVFLLGTSVGQWTAARTEFLRLAGPIPLLPDYAFGTWWTWWHPYTEAQAKGYLMKWEQLRLPLDIWVMDSNWRDSTNGREGYYNHPNTSAFANYTEWFETLRQHKIHIGFIDHPFPHFINQSATAGLQTTPEEVKFRFAGLSRYLEKGLAFWWFDQNWGFSIPPPTVSSCHGGLYGGLDNAAWGSSVYWSVVQHFNEKIRAADPWYGRSMILSKFAKPDWRPGMDAKGHAESPAQHRYPVWWTGDYVSLEASLEAMVDAGLYDMKPYVHSDCGGDIGNEVKGTAGNLIRWTAHCAFGSILRFHGGDHRAWNFDNSTVDTVRAYLDARYRLLPSFIAAGQKATRTGMPVVARLDLFWPEYSESTTNHEYLLFEDMLVAPLWDTQHNESTRSVWLPPGVWQDAWHGGQITGPRTVNVTQPFERIPIWHRRDGGLIVIADLPTSNVQDQDWSELTLEAFPATAAQITHRSVFERGDDASETKLEMRTDGTGVVRFRIGKGLSRAWIIRTHLLPGQRVESMAADGVVVPESGIIILQPRRVDGGMRDSFPLSGRGASPAPRAGPVVEIRLPRTVGDAPRTLELHTASTAYQ